MEENTIEHSLAWELTNALKKQLKQQYIIIIVLILLLFATNIGWLIYEGQYETITDECIEQYQEGVENSSQSGVIN